MPLFNVPDFPSTCDVWFPGSDPLTDAPDLTAIPCQLYVPGVRFGHIPLIGGIPYAGIYDLKVPKGSQTTAWYMVEVNPGSGFIYHVAGSHPVALDFPNEYQVLYVIPDDGTNNYVSATQRWN